MGVLVYVRNMVRESDVQGVSKPLKSSCMVYFSWLLLIMQCTQRLDIFTKAETACTKQLIYISKLQTPVTAKKHK